MDLSRFPTENEWPCVLRNEDLAAAEEALGFGVSSSRAKILLLRGASGVGKTFFAKELIVRLAFKNPALLTLYFDTPPTEFEAVALNHQLGMLLTKRTDASRSHPNAVLAAARDEWTSFVPRKRVPRLFNYCYGTTRELIGQIPTVGRYLRAVMPQRVMAIEDEKLQWGAIPFLAQRARRHPVLLALDNVQNLPMATVKSLEEAFAGSLPFLRLILIERNNHEQFEGWFPPHLDKSCVSMNLGKVDVDSIRTMAKAVISRQSPDGDKAAAAVAVRSRGSLKAAWLLLRTMHTGDVSPQQDERSEPYIELVESLGAEDRAVLVALHMLAARVRLADFQRIVRRLHPALDGDTVGDCVLDLAEMGLLVVDKADSSRLFFEHDLVPAALKTILTGDKLEPLRMQMVDALSVHLKEMARDDEYDLLADRLIGLASSQEVRTKPLVLGHLLSLVERRYAASQFEYLTCLAADEACSGVFDLLPGSTVEALLDSFQKTSSFTQGLASVALMKSRANAAAGTLVLYEAKYLVQMFDYAGAGKLLESAPSSPERDSIQFNVHLNLCKNEDARRRIEQIAAPPGPLAEHECVMLRNAGHLYEYKRSRPLLERALTWFKERDSEFGVGTTLNNLGVIELAANERASAEKNLLAADRILRRLGSNEEYQPLSNLGVLAALSHDWKRAEEAMAMSRRLVPPELAMDRCMLELNSVVLRLMRGQCTGQEAAGKLAADAGRINRLGDLRFRMVASWLSRTLEAHFAPETVAESTGSFELRRDTLFGMEVFFPAIVDGKPIELVLILSPHWRY